MIIYRELSSLEKDLGIPVKKLYTVSNSISKHYHSVSFPKKNGGVRKLSVPDNDLKYIQRRISDVLLFDMPVSPYATAYRLCSSTVKNASQHINKDWVIKLDIANFFDSILYSTVKEKAFPIKKYSEKVRILLAMLCYYKDSLPQGAPSSPAISNIILYSFDMRVGKWCQSKSISYTRYCDDLTFSGNGEIPDIIPFVSRELFKEHFFINSQKTVIAKKHSRQSVTGLIVNKKVNIPSEYKRKIRQEIYYCRKFGVENHIKKADIKDTAAEYLNSLLGKVNYVLSVLPDNYDFVLYKRYLLEQINKTTNFSKNDSLEVPIN